MISITHKNCAYIIGDYVIKNAPIYCKGSRSARDLIKNKEILRDDIFIYIYLYEVNKMTMHALTIIIMWSDRCMCTTSSDSSYYQ